MTTQEQDKLIAELVRRKHAAKREIACLETRLKTLHDGLHVLNVAVRDQAWGQIRREGNRIVVVPDEEKPLQWGDAPRPVGPDDLSLGDIADMAQRILHLTQQITEDEQSLLRCPGDTED